MKIEDFIYVRESAAPLRHLLECWVNLVQRMRVDSGGLQVPYSYKERTNIGVFSNAAVLAGWGALEECAEGKEAGGVIYDGRIDLLLWRDGIRCAFESKLTANSPEKLPGRIRVVFDAAKKDAGKLPKQVGVPRYATVFVLPRFPEGANDTEVAAQIYSVIKECQTHPHEFMAYTFPGKSPRKSPDSQDKGMFAYGVIVMGVSV